MTIRKLKKSVVYGLYGTAFLLVISTIFILEMATSKNFEDDATYVNSVILDKNVPVVNIKESIIRPFNANNISLIKSFYDYKSEAEEQQNALIYYDDTYLQNSGVDYGNNNESFDVLAIYDGEVVNVTENTLLGKCVEIKHENGLISVYQSLGEVSVAKNSKVSRGQVIGVTGVANIDTKLGNHLHFELIHNGENVNPENYYDKKLSEI